MKVPIVQNGDPVLRAVAAPVPDGAFGTPELAESLARMSAALDAAEDGVALAAPQIGISERIFIVRMDRVLPAPLEGAPPHPVEVATYINPVLVKTSRRAAELDEGCLSVRGLYGKTLRHERATVRARRADGTSFERGASGLLAQIFQHEIDHLDGILFIDHATQLVRPEEEAAPHHAED